MEDVYLGLHIISYVDKQYGWKGVFNSNVQLHEVPAKLDHIMSKFEKKIPEVFFKSFILMMVIELL